MDQPSTDFDDVEKPTPSALTNLAQKISAASMVIATGLIPDKKHAFHGYNYISADKTMLWAGKALAYYGVAVVPGVREVIHSDDVINKGKTNEKPFFATTLLMEMTVTDSVESITVPWTGCGTSFEAPDKALFAAITSGHKYFLAKLLSVAIGNENSEHSEDFAKYIHGSNEPDGNQNGNGGGGQAQRQTTNGTNGNGGGGQAQRQTTNGTNGGGQSQASGTGDVTAKDLLARFRADTSGATPANQLVPLKISIGKTIGTWGDEYLGILSVILGYDIDPENPQIPRNMARELMDHAPEVTGQKQSDGKWADVTNPKHNPVYATLVREAWKTAQERAGTPFPT